MSVRTIHPVCLVVAIGLTLASVANAAPVGTAFTYQGRLMDANKPADGLYDLQFKLYDANTAGTQKGITVDVNDIDIIEGRFTVVLGFGSGVFDGNDRWLEIGVRPGGLDDPNEYTFLEPRQRVTPTPYAIYAKTAGVAQSLAGADGSATTAVCVDNGGRVGVGTEAPAYKLDVKGDMHASGAIFAGEGTISINAPYVDSISSTSGRISLGKNLPGVFSDVKIGIGYLSPGFPLSFGYGYGDKISLLGDSGAHYGFGVQNNLLQIHAQTPSSDIAFGYGSSDSFAETVRFKGNGRVGIGTQSPDAILDVNGPIKIRGGSPGNGKVLTSDESGLARWQQPAGGGITAVNPGTGLHGGGTSGEVALNVNVPLHLSGSSIQPIVKGYNSGGGVGVYGYSTNAEAVFGESYNGMGVYGKSTDGYAGYFEGPKNYFSGSVGIGTPSPGLYRLNVNGTSYFDDDIYVAPGRSVDGYDIGAKGPNWDKAYSWGNHADEGYLSEARDFGRSGASLTLYEGTTALSDRYLHISAKAVDANRLDGFDASDFAKADHDHDPDYINANAGEINSEADFGFPESTFIRYLNADKLDGQDASAFAAAGHNHDSDDYGRSGVTTGLYEGTTRLIDKYVQKADLDHLDAADGTPASAVYVDFDGNVGIGMFNPSAALHVAGDIRATSDLHVGLNITASNGYIRTQTPSSTYAAGDIVATGDLVADDNVRATNGYIIAGSPSSSFGNGDIVADDDLIADDDIRCVTGVIFTGSPTAGHTTLDIVSSDDLVCDDDVWASDNIHAGGNISCGGSKTAVMQTADYGKRKLYCEESTELFFLDRGEGRLVNGEVTISLDPIFVQTVTIDQNHPMRVQITLTSDCNGVYVASKRANSFTVRELMSGTSNATFDWEVAAKRKGYEDTRLEVFEEKPDGAAAG